MLERKNIISVMRTEDDKRSEDIVRIVRKAHCKQNGRGKIEGWQKGGCIVILTFRNDSGKLRAEVEESLASHSQARNDLENELRHYF